MVSNVKAPEKLRAEEGGNISPGYGEYTIVLPEEGEFFLCISRPYGMKIISYIKSFFYSILFISLYTKLVHLYWKLQCKLKHNMFLIEGAALVSERNRQSHFISRLCSVITEANISINIFQVNYTFSNFPMILKHC